MIDIKPETIMRHIYAVIPGLAMQAGLELDIFPRLSSNPMDAGMLAEALNLPENKLAPLLYALVTAGLLKFENGIFSNTPETDKYLAQTALLYKEHICFLINRIWHLVSKTAETITSDQPQARLDWLDCTGHGRSALFNGQYAGSVQAGRELGDKVDLSSAERILDSAGGSGGVAVGLYDSCRDSKLTVAELPVVVPFTKAFISMAGLTDKIGVIAADIVRHPPEGLYDAAVLRSFIQVLSPERAVKALINIRKAMIPGGVIYILGHFLDNTRLFPPVSVAHNLLFLNQYEDGRANTEREYRCWLRTTGFEDIRVEYSVFSDGSGLIVARTR